MKRLIFCLIMTKIVYLLGPSTRTTSNTGSNTPDRLEHRKPVRTEPLHLCVTTTKDWTSLETLRSGLQKWTHMTHPPHNTKDDTPTTLGKGWIHPVPLSQTSRVSHVFVVTGLRCEWKGPSKENVVRDWDTGEWRDPWQLRCSSFNDEEYGK